MIWGFALPLLGLILCEAAASKDCSASHTGMRTVINHMNFAGSCRWTHKSQKPLTQLTIHIEQWSMILNSLLSVLECLLALQASGSAEKNHVKKLILHCMHSLAQQCPGFQSSFPHCYALPFEMGSHKWGLMGSTHDMFWQNTCNISSVEELGKAPHFAVVSQ